MNKTDLERFMRDAAEEIRVLSRRDGLAAPNSVLMNRLRRTFLEVAGRATINDELPRDHMPDFELIAARNTLMLKSLIGKSEQDSRYLLKRVNRIDNHNPFTYLRMRFYCGAWEKFQNWRYVRHQQKAYESWAKSRM
ncbi:hypothetical protein [Mycolicibacterium neoaurum]|uniref:hypothetical protein n=1 Tax=Mycolicibacterium neoaurum TaxID=1795 RepID=UPI001F4C588B|nr:hypothetical protein [Mycolicibacterium neoaurum]